MNYQSMKRHGGTLNAYYYVKETYLKGTQSVWFQVYDILDKLGKMYADSKKDQMFAGLRSKEK